MLARHADESQRAFVERLLRSEGEVHTYDVLYNATFDDGRKTSITRLAAIIHTLRAEGWSIDTREHGGAVATYVLRERSMAWRCTSCGSLAPGEPEPLLGGLGQMHCLNCRQRRTFQKRAAA